MRVPFIKMHGLGNDFVVLDARDGQLRSLGTDRIRKLADRRTGIGCDQLILLEPSDEADAQMRIFNQDGGEVEACGNASRAIAMLLGGDRTLSTKGGRLIVRGNADGAEVDIGVPRFEWDAIPLAYPMDTLSMPVGWDGLDAPGAANVGNPHVVFFVDDCDAVALEQIGPTIETDPLFPDRINVNVATIESPERIRLRVWERGVGLTRACGTGACATAAVAMRRSLTARRVTVALPGGELDIVWRDDGHIVMTGAATESFRGTFEWDDFA